MNRGRLWDFAAKGVGIIAQRSGNSLNSLKTSFVVNPIAQSTDRQPSESAVKPSQFGRLTQFWTKAITTIVERNDSTMREGLSKLTESTRNQAEKGSEAIRFSTETEQPIEKLEEEKKHSEASKPSTFGLPESIEMAAVDNLEVPDKELQIGHSEAAALNEEPPAIDRAYSFQDSYKPSQQLSVYLTSAVQTILNRQRSANNSVKQKFSPLNQHSVHTEQAPALENSVDPKAEALRSTANFPTSLEDVDTEPPPNPVEPTHVSESPKLTSSKRLSIEASKALQPVEQYVQSDPQGEKHFAEYVEEERMSKLKYDVQQLKKEHHLITNYDASDEQSFDPSHSRSYLNPRYKHKTETSNNSISRIFQPRIYVIEAPEKSNGSTINLVQKEWPATEPKKHMKHSSRRQIAKSLIRSPAMAGSINTKQRGDSFGREVAHYAQKILKLKEARKKKMLLEEKLEMINKEIEDIKNPEVALDDVRHSKSPKNTLKEMIDISDDKEAKTKALMLVRRLRNQRDKREKAVSSIFARVDKEMMDSIAELSHVRQEQERQAKERKKLEVLERMRNQQRRKLDEYRLLAENSSFIQALKHYENRTKPKQSRRSMEWIRADDTPQLAARKELLEKLRNLSYIEKRSIIEDYNRQLMRK